MSQNARNWLSEGIRKGEIEEAMAMAIMKIIDNPEIIPQLELECNMLKDALQRVVDERPSTLK